ncbi:MAG: MurR/RpiR family transcriptional regulator [Holdemanella sp.]|nr:MurR/RpiR family transcriptional regulator [Holdemanella sp.]
MKAFDRIDIHCLSDTERIIYDYFLKNTGSIPYKTLSDLCNELYVSNASIVRFTQKLGFSGFNDFKFALKEELTQLHTNTDFQSLVPKNTAKIKDFIENIDMEQAEQIVDLILTNPSIYIYGRDLSSIPANYIHTMLTTLDISCILIDWKEFIKALAPTFPKDSLLILFTNRGLTDEYKMILSDCLKNNVTIVGITSTKIDESDIKYMKHYIYTPETNMRTKTTTFSYIQILVELLISRLNEKRA